MHELITLRLQPSEMHAWWIRGNAVLTLCTSVLAAVCIAVTITGASPGTRCLVPAAVTAVCLLVPHHKPPPLKLDRDQLGQQTDSGSDVMLR